MSNLIMAIDNLIDGINLMKAPIVAGLDPRFSDIPEHIRQEAKEQAGPTREGIALAFTLFNKGLIDALAGVIPAVKPQIAFYEQYGAPGVKAYEDTVGYAKAKGLAVIGDAKRNDIGSTAQAYADGHIGLVESWGEPEAGYDADFVTVNPYLGRDGLLPFIKWSREKGKGIFVLVRTSNPSAAEIQDLRVAEKGCPVYHEVARLTAEIGKDCIGRHGFSSAGAVVGATYPAEAAELRSLLPRTFFLVPGYGAQGAGAEDVMPAFDSNGQGAVVNSSRGIIFAYKLSQYSRYGSRGYADAARQAAIAMRDDIGRALDRKLGG